MIDCVIGDTRILREQVKLVYDASKDDAFKSAVEEIARYGSVDLLALIAAGNHIPVKRMFSTDYFIPEIGHQLDAINALGTTGSKKALDYLRQLQEISFHGEKTIEHDATYGDCDCSCQGCVSDYWHCCNSECEKVEEAWTETVPSKVTPVHLSGSLCDKLSKEGLPTEEECLRWLNEQPGYRLISRSIEKIRTDLGVSKNLSEVVK